MATAKMRGLVAVSIRQRESSPWRKEGREVLAGQYLDSAAVEANVVVVGSNIEDSISVIVEPCPVYWTPLEKDALKFIESSFNKDNKVHTLKLNMRK